MPVNDFTIARAGFNPRRYKVIELGAFSRGLVTVIPPSQLQRNECHELVNWNIVSTGSKSKKLVSRRAIERVSNSPTTSNSKVVSIASVLLNGIKYILLQDENNRLYYLDSSNDPVLLGTLEGRATIVSYSGAVVLLDGSYIKYLSSIPGDITICYDGGTGSHGYFFDHTDEDQDGSDTTADATKYALRYTTPDWNSDYGTIPPVGISAVLSKEGSPTGSVVASIYKMDNTLVAQRALVSCDELSTSPALYSVAFTDDDITSELEANTSYYIAVEHTGADSGNYVKVWYKSDTLEGGGYHWDGSSWNAQTNKSYLLALRPGLPPKSAFGVVKDERLYSAGDPDNRGYLWYSNLSYLDWSTPNGGGYIGIIDSDRNNYEVGGLATLYNDLLIFGTETQPYICRLSGSSPSDYSVQLLFQRSWTTHRTVVQTANDIWFASADGVDPISGVQEYGDLRTFSASDSIKDRIADYWDSDTAIAGYYPALGQFWLVLPSYHRVLVAHTKDKYINTATQQYGYPWVEHEYYRDLLTSDSYQWVESSSGTNEYYLQASGGGDPQITTKPDFLTMDDVVLTEGTISNLSDHQWGYGDNDGLGYNTIYVADATGNPSTSGVVIRSILVPTAICTNGSNILLGGSDGHIYQVSSSATKDLSTVKINPIIKTMYVESPLSNIVVKAVHLLIYSNTGGQITVTVYRDGLLRTPAFSSSIYLPIIDNITVDEATMDVDDAYFAIDGTEVFQRIYLNMLARSVIIKLHNMTISGDPITLDRILLEYRRLSY